MLIKAIFSRELISFFIKFNFQCVAFKNYLKYDKILTLSNSIIEYNYLFRSVKLLLYNE